MVALAACSSGSKSNNSEGSTGSPNNGGSVSEPSGTNAPEGGDAEGSPDTQTMPEMDFDMGGKTIKVVAWYDKTINEENPDNIQRRKNLEAFRDTRIIPVS